MKNLKLSIILSIIIITLITLVSSIRKPNRKKGDNDRVPGQQISFVPYKDEKSNPNKQEESNINKQEESNTNNNNQEDKNQEDENKPGQQTYFIPYEYEKSDINKHEKSNTNNNNQEDKDQTNNKISQKTNNVYKKIEQDSFIPTDYSLHRYNKNNIKNLKQIKYNNKR